MKKTNIRKWLRSYRREDINFTTKAEIRYTQRKISRELIEDNLLRPKNLIHKKEEGQPNPLEYKFKLYFRLSNAYTLCVRVTLNKRIKVITTYIIINKLQKGMWLKWKK